MDSTNRPDADPRPTITRIAGGVYQPPGGVFAVRVTASEDWLLQAFLRRPAMSLAELVDQSGVAHAHKVLRALQTKYGGAFASAIRRPGSRGRGGYSVLVQNGASIRPATLGGPCEES
jgi:hypothetical protein